MGNVIIYRLSGKLQGVASCTNYQVAKLVMATRFWAYSAGTA